MASAVGARVFAFGPLAIVSCQITLSRTLSSVCLLGGILLTSALKMMRPLMLPLVCLILLVLIRRCRLMSLPSPMRSRRGG